MREEGRLLRDRLQGQIKVFVGLAADWLKMGKVEQKVVLLFAKNLIEWYEQRFGKVNQQSPGSIPEGKQLEAE